MTSEGSLGHLTTNEVVLVLSGELFQRLALGLRDQEGREDTGQHEESEDLENVADESVGATNVTKRGEPDLGDDSTKFAGSGGNTVGGGTVTSGEDLTGDDEGGGVGAEVLEKVGEAIEEDESFGSTSGGDKLVVAETHGDEGASEDDKAHQLDRLASPKVDEKEGNPVSGDETSDRKNQVADGDVPQVEVDLFGCSAFGGRAKTDGGQDDGRVKTETIESDVESEPGPGSAEQYLSVLPLTEVAAEVSPRGPRNIDLVGDEAVIWSGLDALGGTIDVLDGLFHVTFDVEGETRGLWNSETEVESDDTGDASKTDEETPTVVNGLGVGGWLGNDGTLVGSDDDYGDDAGGEVTETLGGEGGSHHTATNPSGSKLGRDDGRKWVITTDTDTHNETPYNEDTDDVNSRGLTRESLAKSGNDDDDELNTIHPLSTDDISQPTEQELTNQSADRGGDFDAKILMGGEFTTFAIDITQHGGGDVDSENIVGIGEETNTGD